MRKTRRTYPRYFVIFTALPDARFDSVGDDLYIIFNNSRQQHGRYVNKNPLLCTLSPYWTLARCKASIKVRRMKEIQAAQVALLL